MIAVNERCSVRIIAERWRKQYQCGTTWTRNLHNDAQAIYDQLCALDPVTSTLADIDRIIGNSSWTSAICVGCEVRVTDYVRFASGEDEVDICGDCLQKATDLLRLTSG